MRFLTHIALQVVFWGALYQVVQSLANERMIVAAFGATLAISLSAAAVYFAKP